MAKIIPSEFTQYSFTESELKAATIFTESNLQFIQHQLASAMLERAHLEFNTNQPLTSFVQQEAALAGQISAFRFLLDAHQTTVSGLSELDPD